MRIRTITSEMPAVVLVDQGGTDLLVRPIWHDGPGDQRNIKRNVIIGAEARYTVTHTKGLTVASKAKAEATRCASLAAAMKVVAEVMAESPEGQVVDRITIRSASGYQVFTADYRPEDGWRAFDDTAFRR
ncbi:MAG: hypothetical protein AB7W59_00335 [Acidimicrobiia bacterium]